MSHDPKQPRSTLRPDLFACAWVLMLLVLFILAPG